MGMGSPIDDLPFNKTPMDSPLPINSRMENPSLLRGRRRRINKVEARQDAFLSSRSSQAATAVEIISFQERLQQNSLLRPRSHYERALQELQGMNQTTAAPAGNSHNSSGLSTSDNGPFLILLTVLVAMICLFYVICTYQMMRMWLCQRFCKRDNDDPNAAAADSPLSSGDNAAVGSGGEALLVHAGRMFNLTEHQRRAVLEAIFSETSKPVTDQDVKKKKKRKKRGETIDCCNDDDDDENNDNSDDPNHRTHPNQGGIPMDVEIPSIPTVGMDNSIDDEPSRGLEMPSSPVKEGHLSPHRPDHGVSQNRLSDECNSSLGDDDDEDDLHIQSGLDHGDGISEKGLALAYDAPVGAPENIVDRSPDMNSKASPDKAVDALDDIRGDEDDDNYVLGSPSFEQMPMDSRPSTQSIILTAATSSNWVPSPPVPPVMLGVSLSSPSLGRDTPNTTNDDMSNLATSRVNSYDHSPMQEVNKHADVSIYQCDGEPNSNEIQHVQTPSKSCSPDTLGIGHVNEIDSAEVNALASTPVIGTGRHTASFSLSTAEQRSISSQLEGPALKPLCRSLPAVEDRTESSSSSPTSPQAAESVSAMMEPHLALPELSKACRGRPKQHFLEDPSTNDATVGPSLPSLPGRTSFSASARRTSDLSIPEDAAVVVPLGEESKEEIEELQQGPATLERTESTDSDDLTTMAALSMPIPLRRGESYTTAASEYTYDDDSTGDNVCPICLSGYRKGEVLIVSKYCTHMFHKDCILEWLEKHDDCPICRTGMVTDSEMSRAATSLVGKTRMYRAVASMQSIPGRTHPQHPMNHRHLHQHHQQQNYFHRTPPSSPPQRAHPSPFHGTVRRHASMNSNTG